MDDTKFHMISAYLQLGWALVPLHDVSAGRCSCGDRECRSAGKHPRLGRWQEEGQLVRSPEVLHSIVEAHPEWNWGAATGEPSGFFAVDYDPAHAGQEAAAWWRVLDPLGTRTHITGSNGRHWLFSMPNDFVPRNVGRKARGDGRVPVGIDIRGWHGQIVLPPSISGKGPYKESWDGPILPPPSWLCDAIRPQTYEAPPPGVSNWNGGGELGDRGRRYAAAAGAALLDELRAAPVGTRNDTAFSVACRVWELVNAGWVGEETAAGAWWAAAEAHPDGERVPASELDGLWRRACERVAGKVATLPGGWGGELVPFSSPAMGPGGSSANGGAPEVTSASPIDSAEAMIGRMLTAAQMRALPAPEPLVSGLLDLNTCAWLVGARGSFKSFVGLDLAAHVGRGETWHGRAVRRGGVVYIVAEGAGGMRLRVDAWEREYGPMEGVLFLPEPVLVDERRGADGWTTLVKAYHRLAPALVVIDTQARAAIGLKENDNSDMSYYAAQADRIKAASGACVLSVHHTGHGGDRARGASSIEGAQDSALYVYREKGGMHLELRTSKQKDMAESKPVKLRLRVSDGGIDPRTGRDLSSLVVERDTDIMLDPDTPDGMTETERRAILLYQLMAIEFVRGDGGTYAEIKKAFCAAAPLASMAAASREKAFRRAWSGDQHFAGLLPRGLVLRATGQARFRLWVIEDQSTEGVLTPSPDDGSVLPPDGWNVYRKEDKRDIRA